MEQIGKNELLAQFSAQALVFVTISNSIPSIPSLRSTNKMPLAAITPEQIAEQVSRMDPDLRLQLTRNDVNQHVIAILSQAKSFIPPKKIRGIREVYLIALQLSSLLWKLAAGKCRAVLAIKSNKQTEIT
jgi:hypothetical protein